MKSYHFSLGNSNTGPIGFCARVEALSKEDAVYKLKSMIEKVAGREMELRKWLQLGHNAPDIEYFNVYLNPDKITIRSIDDWEEVVDGAKTD